MSTIPNSVADFTQILKDRWHAYQAQPEVDQFVEFTLGLNAVAEQCKERKLPGLARLCEGLRHQVLALSADPLGHPLNLRDINALGRQVDTILSTAKVSLFPKAEERRLAASPAAPEIDDAVKPRTIWLISDAAHPWSEALAAQLTLFGFRVCRFSWDRIDAEESSPLVILFLPLANYKPKEIDRIRTLRALHPASQLFCLAVPELLDPMVALLRAGADITIPAAQETTTVLAHVLDLIESQDQEPYRILVVEDSPTAIAAIRKTLSQQGIDTLAINNPEQLLEAVWQYRPDLVLMDMHMPHCTGIEATRVLRQLPAGQSLPVVYLSSETNMAMQVEALRLGGDQFITKPFNPVLLTTVVKTKIERYRDMLRTSQRDGLTGLLNPTASKARLHQLVQSLDVDDDTLCVAMLDIDHFKSINDVHGHPAGDQVIRNLAWLLKGRLRTSDIIGRYGGEEFLVVLRGIGLDDAYVALDRIRCDFANLPHTHGGESLSASFSAGIAAYPGFSSSKKLIDAADQALLEAKRNGRNRIERSVWSPVKLTRRREH